MTPSMSPIVNHGQFQGSVLGPSMHSLFIPPITTTLVRDVICSLDYSDSFLTWLPTSTTDYLQSSPPSSHCGISKGLCHFSTQNPPVVPVSTGWKTYHKVFITLLLPTCLPPLLRLSPLLAELTYIASLLSFEYVRHASPRMYLHRLHFAWNGICPDFCMSLSLTSFRTPLKCQLLS